MRKLIKYAPEISSLIAPSVCDRYVFLVPKPSNKHLLVYAAGKTKEIRGNKLSFCSSDFEIVVHSLSDFSEERKLLTRSRFKDPQLIVAKPPAAVVGKWMLGHSSLATTMREKLEALDPKMSPGRIEDRLQDLVVKYLFREEVLAELESKYYELFLEVKKATHAREVRLQTVGSDATGMGDRLLLEFDALYEDLMADPVTMPSQDASEITAGTIAAWLAECTLETRGSGR